MTTVTIHQPGYLPWAGFFDKMARSDVFVFLDDVQFEKNYFDNRNKIKTAKGWAWVTVPVKHSFGQKLNEVAIDNTFRWKEKHYKSLETNYIKAPYFSEHKPFFDEIYNKKDWRKLIDLNLFIIKYIAVKLGLKTKLVNSSELRAKGAKGGRLLDICQKLKADVYLSGRFGRDYLDEKKFEDGGVKVIYQDFKHPSYPQLFGEFASELSIIDLLLNCGPESLRVILGEK